MSLLYSCATAALRLIFSARISGPPIFTPTTDYFAAASRFAASWQAIRDEATRISETPERAPRFHELMPEQTEISASDGRDWRMFFLKAYGVEVNENMEACPTLGELVKATPQVLSAGLSFLAPHKHIPPHRGPFRGILRFHLMLDMPLAPDGRPASTLIIDGKEYRLNNGECLLWDDTYVHEVANEGDRARIALLLDVWRPSMPTEMILLSRMVVFFVQTTMKFRGVSFTG